MVYMQNAPHRPCVFGCVVPQLVAPLWEVGPSRSLSSEPDPISHPLSELWKVEKPSSMFPYHGASYAHKSSPTQWTAFPQTMNQEKPSFKVAAVRCAVTAPTKVANTSFNLFLSQKLNRKPKVRLGGDGFLNDHWLLYTLPRFVQGTGTDWMRVKRQRGVLVLRKQNPDAGTKNRKGVISQK